MKAPACALVTLLVLSVFPSLGRAAPVVVGLSGKHPLTQPEVGLLLLGELRCNACHTRKSDPTPLDKAAPDLTDVGTRVAPGYLRRFLAAPSAVHAGTSMPDLLAGEPEGQREKIAEALTHFLVARSPRPFQRDAIPAKDAAVGRTLFHTVGCVACHSPRDEAGKETIGEGVVTLGHVPAKYSLASLADFLFQPTRVRPSGRMPDMKLTQAEARALASYLLGGAEPAMALQPKDELVALGAKSFQQFNCAACHKVADIPAAPAGKDLGEADLTRGCLDGTPGKAPRFHLSDDQTKAIRAALGQRPEPLSDKALLATTLTAFNCIGCHTRDDYGGIAADRNPLFKGGALNLGDDGRIPPPLTRIGAKLQTGWTKKVLFDGESIRPYMLARMPQYGEPNLRHLPALLARVDGVDPFTFSMPDAESGNDKERKRAQQLRDAGRKLLGNTSLNCVACHNLNAKRPLEVGTELMTTTQRLQPGYFKRFLRDPAGNRPRIVMPISWPGGKAVDTSVLDGDTDRQIEAIWYYLSLGTSAPDPAGLEPAETKLAVTDAPRTYRGRSSVAGFRGIAVGFPERLNYAFNAETGTLTALWRGDFIRVDRGGQGSGAFNPAARHVALAQDVSFYALPDEKQPWPLRPIMTREKPVNPDPLYPKNRGYQFKGYSLDEAEVPTFEYRSGDLAIEDRAHPAVSGDKVRLVRELTFDAPRAQTVWFRALTGKIEADSKQQFHTSDLRLTIPPAPTLLRPDSADPNRSELLLKLEIPQGRSKLSFTYELLH